jgi:hypothetical protein
MGQATGQRTEVREVERHGAGEMGIERFEELHAWREGRKLVRTVYELCRKPGLKSDHELRRQMQAAGISTMANIACPVK